MFGNNIIFQGDNQLEFLNDKRYIVGRINKKVKKVNWEKYKNASILLSNSYKRLNNHKFHRVKECASYLVFKKYDNGDMKLHSANFCKVRLCPMCAWRRSLKIFAQVSRVMDKLQLLYKYNFLFLTLTCRNVYADELSSCIDNLFYGFRKLMLSSKYKSVVYGSFRCLEVTYNDVENTYHPHIHCILAVDSAYFKKQYIARNVWSRMWSKAIGADYSVIVDIRRFKTSKRGLGCEIAEVAKYAVKSSDMFIVDENGELDEKRTDEVIKTLDIALSNRRLTAYSGVLKKIHHDINLDDCENGDLIHLNDCIVSDDLAYILEKYSWHVGYSKYIRDNDL